LNVITCVTYVGVLSDTRQTFLEVSVLQRWY